MTLSITARLTLYLLFPFVILLLVGSTSWRTTGALTRDVDFLADNVAQSFLQLGRFSLDIAEAESGLGEFRRNPPPDRQLALVDRHQALMQQAGAELRAYRTTSIVRIKDLQVT